MPIYEYSCEKCGKTIEVIQKMSDKPLRKHEKCGGKLSKLISASGFQFKGTGWYVTDYAKKSAPAASKDGDAEKAAAAKGEQDKGATAEKAAKSEPADGAAKKSEPAAAAPTASSTAAPSTTAAAPTTSTT